MASATKPKPKTPIEEAPKTRAELVEKYQQAENARDAERRFLLGEIASLEAELQNSPERKLARAKLRLHVLTVGGEPKEMSVARAALEAMTPDYDVLRVQLQALEKTLHADALLRADDHQRRDALTEKLSQVRVAAAQELPRILVADDATEPELALKAIRRRFGL